MGLTINQNNDVYTLKGALTTITAKNFLNHFESILKTENELTVNIENISEIDRNGVNAFIALHKNSLLNNKTFHIIGNGSKDIYDELKYNLSA